ncbi:MAG: cell wall metabolism sensor histidine kinase WalK, partial [Desulfobulbaceae bacterium]|nr:cell wall metabolism sensor histidine kinase WalK [Desulfobulbaceae bacterium]
SGFGSAVRYSDTLGKNMIYVALPIVPPTKSHPEGKSLGFLRVAVPIASVGQTLRGLALRVVSGSLLLALTISFIAHRVARSISRPLEQMKLSAELFAAGNFEQMVPIRRVRGLSVELAGLGDTLNNMARQLKERINTITSQRNQLEAVFAGMKEAVIVIDFSQRFINVNQAAEKLLGMERQNILGKTVLEIIRNHGLQMFISSTLDEDEPVTEDIVLHDESGDIYLLGHGSRLCDQNALNIGAVIVFNDITRLRRLETVRRDFVANVSHELRTPITTIKGFVETLLEGALGKPEEASRFLTIIAKNVNRLSAIIEDLLILSRLELHGRELAISFQRERIYKVLSAAKEACEPAAEKKKIRLVMSCPAGLEADVNTRLLEQALVNLIGNAIKYSREGESVVIEASDQGQDVVIQVKDEGCGISAEHLPRIFERFYRSDKARSRKEGGTGLGLSIVRHIVEAHGGVVNVSSTPGKGTIFFISLPLGAGEVDR